MVWAQLAATRAPAPPLSPTLASHSGKRSSRRINGSPSPSSSSRRKQPSVAEVQRAIGLVDDDALRMMKAADPPPSTSSSSGSSSSPSSFLDLLSSTPIGQAEGPAERKLREVAEWVVDQTEANAKSGQQILLVVCLKILPVWVLLLLVASGVIKFPFDLPFIDDLIS